MVAKGFADEKSFGAETSDNAKATSYLPPSVKVQGTTTTSGKRTAALVYATIGTKVNGSHSV